ncbi:MAG: 50S ribosomal protein L10 [Acidobacteria bacterium]|nr:50S ribosomal protein L10 [Acidobacteriota bacterium]MBI3655189.1 50S ribosomal protein L10 [Acidobacteriota bacterium]
MIREARSAFLIDYRGLKVVAATELRQQIRKISSEYEVVKNTLALRAVKDTRMEHLSPFFKGPTAIALSRREDAPALAKLLMDFAKGHPAIVFKAAVVEGQVFPAEAVPEISKLPSREELIGKLVYLLKSPVSRLSSVLNAPLRNLALDLSQIQK